VLFFSQIPLGIALRLVENPIAAGVLLLLTVAWLVAFEWAFLKAARLAGMSVEALVPIAVLLLVPFVGLITLLVVDFKIADTVDRGRGQAANPGPSALARLGRACRPLAGSSVDLSALVASGDLWRMTRRSPSAVPPRAANPRNLRHLRITVPSASPRLCGSPPAVPPRAANPRNLRHLRMAVPSAPLRLCGSPPAVPAAGGQSIFSAPLRLCG